MNDMTDAQISKALALAIGYRPEHVKGTEKHCAVYRTHSRLMNPYEGLYVFDYRDPAVIWPIAERFDCFPRMDQYQQWFAGKYPYAYADTAAKAAALAVIAAHGG